MADCPHCPDGHQEPWKATWGAHVDVFKDGDGQPTIVAVSKTGGSHVADIDAEWIFKKLRGTPEPMEVIDWLDWMADEEQLGEKLPGLAAVAQVLREQIGEALLEMAGPKATKAERRRIKRWSKRSRFREKLMDKEEAKRKKKGGGFKPGGIVGPPGSVPPGAAGAVSPSVIINMMTTGQEQMKDAAFREARKRAIFKRRGIGT